MPETYKEKMAAIKAKRTTRIQSTPPKRTWGDTGLDIAKGVGDVALGLGQMFVDGPAGTAHKMANEVTGDFLTETGLSGSPWQGFKNTMSKAPINVVEGATGVPFREIGRTWDSPEGPTRAIAQGAAGIGLNLLGARTAIRGGKPGAGAPPPPPGIPPVTAPPGAAPPIRPRRPPVRTMPVDSHTAGAIPDLPPSPPSFLRPGFKEPTIQPPEPITVPPKLGPVETPPAFLRPGFQEPPPKLGAVAPPGQRALPGGTQSRLRKLGLTEEVIGAMSEEEAAVVLAPKPTNAPKTKGESRLRRDFPGNKAVEQTSKQASSKRPFELARDTDLAALEKRGIKGATEEIAWRKKNPPKGEGPSLKKMFGDETGAVGRDISELQRKNAALKAAREAEKGATNAHEADRLRRLRYTAEKDLHRLRHGETDVLKMSKEEFEAYVDEIAPASEDLVDLYRNPRENPPFEQGDVRAFNKLDESDVTTHPFTGVPGKHFKASQAKVNRPQIEDVKAKGVNAPGTSERHPPTVDYNPNTGEMVIMDGHHRMTAAYETNTRIPMELQDWSPPSAYSRSLREHRGPSKTLKDLSDRFKFLIDDESGAVGKDISDIQKRNKLRKLYPNAEEALPEVARKKFGKDVKDLTSDEYWSAYDDAMDSAQDLTPEQGTIDLNAKPGQKLLGDVGNVEAIGPARSLPKVRSETGIDGNTRVWVDDTEMTHKFGPGGPTDMDIRQLHNSINDPRSRQRLEELKFQQAQREMYGEPEKPLPSRPIGDQPVIDVESVKPRKQLGDVGEVLGPEPPKTIKAADWGDWGGAEKALPDLVNDVDGSTVAKPQSRLRRMLGDETGAVSPGMIPGKWKRKAENPHMKPYRGWVNYRNAAAEEGHLKGKGFRDLDAAGSTTLHDFQKGNRTGRLNDVQRYLDTVSFDMSQEGVKPNFKKNYLFQIFDSPKQEILDVARRLKLRPEFSAQSVLDNMEIGESVGLKPKFQNMGDFVGWYERTARLAIADRMFFNSLKAQDLIRGSRKAPADWKSIDPDLFPIRSREGFKAPPEVAKTINNYLRDPAEQGSVWAASADVAGITKNMILSSGAPGTALNAHGVNITVRSLLNRGPLKAIGTLSRLVNTGAEGKIPQTIERLAPWQSAKAHYESIRQTAPRAMKHGLTLTSEEHKMNSVGSTHMGKSLGKTIENMPGKRGVVARTAFKPLEKGLDWVLQKHGKYFEDPLFRNVVPDEKLSLFNDLYGDFLKKGLTTEEAGRSAAELANDAYGGINWEAMGNSRDGQNALRSLILAPDWFRTNLRTMKGLTKANLNPRAAESKQYAYMVRNLLGAYVAAEVANKLSSGHHIWENDPGHKLQIQMGKSGTKNRYINPFGTAVDFFRLPLETAASAAQGDLSQGPKILKNRLSTLVQPTINILKNEDDFGRPLAGKDAYGRQIGLGKQMGNYLGEVGGMVLPSYIANPMELATGKHENVEQALLGSVEAPVRYAKPSQKGVRKQRARSRTR